MGSGDAKEGDKTKNSVQVSFTLGKWRVYKAENHAQVHRPPVLLLGNTLTTKECPHLKMPGYPPLENVLRAPIVKCSEYPYCKVSQESYGNRSKIVEETRVLVIR